MNKTILIVDDDRATSTLLQTLFQIEGYASIICPRPENVLPTAQDQQPDLILMDFHLGDVESLDVLKDIRADAELEAIPVVMLSGIDRGDQCLKAGANAFVQKPFKPADLLNVIKKHIARE